MKVDGKHIETIWLDPEDTLHIIDQRKLPFAFRVEQLTNYKEVCTAIREMWVRGAPLIGVTAAYGMYLATLDAPEAGFMGYMESAATALKETRPTAINLFREISASLEALKKGNTHAEKIRMVKENADRVKKREIENCLHIGKHGLPLIKEIFEKNGNQPVNILTHCNAGWLACIDYGTATAPIYLAHDQGIPVHVWVDETRPRNQGARLTAWELGQHGVPHTVIADNTGGYLMQQGKVDLVIVGSDRTTSNGDVANKIGTYLKALAAWDNQVPFYVALPSSSIDWSLTNGIKEIPIEQRDEEEVSVMEGMTASGTLEKVRIIPENSRALNVGFDITPARYVTGLITERGICNASQEGMKMLFPEKYNP